MPDEFDYAWLAWLIHHPMDWSAEDAEKAEFVLNVQREDLATVHPRDVRGERSKQKLVRELEAAIATYRSSRGQGM
jgi:hypothetical protein